LNLNRRKTAARKWYIVKHLGRNFKGGLYRAPVKFCAKLISGRDCGLLPRRTTAVMEDKKHRVASSAPLRNYCTYTYLNEAMPGV